MEKKHAYYVDSSLREGKQNGCVGCLGEFKASKNTVQKVQKGGEASLKGGEVLIKPGTRADICKGESKRGKERLEGELAQEVKKVETSDLGEGRMGVRYGTDYHPVSQNENMGTRLEGRRPSYAGTGEKVNFPGKKLECHQSMQIGRGREETNKKGRLLKGGTP